MNIFEILEIILFILGILLLFVDLPFAIYKVNKKYDTKAKNRFSNKKSLYLQDIENTLARYNIDYDDDDVLVQYDETYDKKGMPLSCKIVGRVDISGKFSLMSANYFYSERYHDICFVNEDAAKLYL